MSAVNSFMQSLLVTLTVLVLVVAVSCKRTAPPAPLVPAPVPNNLDVPILIAAIDRNAELREVMELLDAGASVTEIDRRGRFPLMLALEAERLDLFELLLKRGADVNQSDPLGMQVVHVAAGFSARALQLCLDHRADVNAADRKYGWTPVYFAVSGGNNESLEILLAHPSVDWCKPDLRGALVCDLLATTEASVALKASIAAKCKSCK